MSNTFLYTMDDRGQRKAPDIIDSLQTQTRQNLAQIIVQDRSQAIRYLPLEWKEVKPDYILSSSLINNIKKSVEKKGDLVEGVLGKGLNIPSALQKMEMAHRVNNSEM